MGTILTKDPVRKINKNLILDLKKNTMKDIFDSIEIVHHKYPSFSLLDYTKFDDIFSCLASDTEPIFYQLRENYGKNPDNSSKYLVDLFESLAIFALFSSEPYEVKIAFIFRLFDFDVSETIEPSELTMSVQCVVRGLCKMVNLMPPGYTFLENISKTCFQIMDLDHNSHIEFHEYITWISSNDDFQEFLTKYSGTYSYPYAKKKLSETLAKFEEIFKKNAKEQEEIEEKVLRKALKFELQYFDKEIVDYFFNVLVFTSSSELKFIEDDDKKSEEDSDSEHENDQKVNALQNFPKGKPLRKKLKSEEFSEESDEDEGSALQKRRNRKEVEKTYMNFEKFHKISMESSKREPGFPAKMIKFCSFMNVMKAWASFSAADLNFDNYLSINELKMLLWIYEDEEPNEWRLKAEMREIDKDGNQSIDRLEWLKHLCVEDHKSGKQIFRSEVKRLFEKYDKNNQGFLTNSQVKRLVKNTFKGYVKKAKDEKTKYNLKMIIANLSKEIMEALNLDGDKNLNWSEFKYFIDKTLEKQENLAHFLESTMV